MKRFYFCLIALLGLTACSWGQNSITAESTDYGLIINHSPFLCVGEACTPSLNDPTLEVEPLTPTELADLSAAQIKADAAASDLRKLKQRIALAHGDQPYQGGMNYLVCNKWEQKHVSIFGKYAFRTTEEHFPCTATFATGGQ